MSALPKTYKAVQCAEANGPWKIVDLPMREPAPDEVLIRIHASGICFSDHLVKEGKWPGLQYPRVPGHEVIGRVVRAGSSLKNAPGSAGRFIDGALVGVGWNGGYCKSCDQCRRGDFWSCRTVAYTGFMFDGGMAEYIFAPETAVVSLPEDVLKNSSYAELAPLCCAGATVFDAIRTSKWSPGDICLVQGIGGLGHLAVQYASKLGLKVYAISSGSSKRDLALSLGAYEYVDSSTTNVVEYISGLGGAQLIVCTAPQSKLISSLIPAVGTNGTITLVSAAIDGPIEVQNLLLNMKRCTLRGYACGCSPDTERCISYSAASGVKAMVKTFSLAEFEKAYDGVMQNTARFRNVIVFP